MKRITSILLVSAFVLLLSACATNNAGNTEPSKQANGKDSNGTDTPSKDQERVTLHFYTVSDYDKMEYDAIIPEWNKLHPDIEVKIVVLTGADGWDKIRTALAGGEKIDIAMMERDMFYDKADKMYLRLNDSLEQAGMNYLYEFGEYGRATMVGDDIYGIAKILSPSGVIYNKKVFDQAGVQLPDDNTWTYADYFDVIKQLTQKDGKRVSVYGGMHWQYNYAGILDLATYGGWDVVTEDGKPNIDSPILKSAAEMYHKALFIDQSMPTDADIQATSLSAVYGVFGGQIGTTLAASNNLLAMDEFRVGGQLPEEADENDWIGLLKMPRWDQNSPANQITTIVTSYSIARASEHPEEAFEFLKWYTTKGLELSAKVAHRIPAWKHANREQLVKDWRYYPGKDGQLVEGKARDELYAKALDPSLVAIFPKYRSLYPYSALMLQELRKELTLVLAGEKEIEKALNDAQKAAEAIYEREKQ
ncbi:extracellular solute-binding protein [Paenibacillus sp. J5C_2022]|nr:extracellular solute-binding protein [Paenibacillus sp. J5C2022]